MNSDFCHCQPGRFFFLSLGASTVTEKDGIHKRGLCRLTRTATGRPAKALLGTSISNSIRRRIAADAIPEEKTAATIVARINKVELFAGWRHAQPTKTTATRKA